MTTMDDHNPNFSRLLPYYQREMAYLLKVGQRFSQAYPGVATGLDLGPKGSGDPHVERLLESFAFMAGRLQMEAEDQYPEIVANLLGVLYPDFVQPFPACTVMQLHSTQTSQPEAQQVPARTPLSVSSQEGLVCRFQTTMATELWPLETQEVDYVLAQSYDVPASMLRSPFLLKVTLKSLAGPLRDFAVRDLAFYLGSDSLTAMTLLKWLCTYDPVASTPILVQQDPRKKVLEHLQGSVFERVGFEPEEGLIPSSPKVGHAYRLLFDFFQFPQKFLFFRLKNIGSAFSHAVGDTLSLFFPLGSHAEPDKWPLTSQAVLPGCVPAVNLFPRTSEPIHLDHRTTSHRLVADYRLEETTEVHRILRVSSASAADEVGEVMAPYFSYTHTDTLSRKDTFWLSRVAHTSLENAKGTDTFLSFVDHNMQLTSTKDKTVYAHTLCSNRRLAEKLQVGVRMGIEGKVSDAYAVMLLRPTRPLAPLTSGEAQWHLIHHLSVDHLGLCAEQKSVRPLKEFLSLYNRTDPSLKFAIESLQGLSFKREVGLVPGHAWKSLAPLLSVRITGDEKLGNNRAFFLLSMLLSEWVQLNAPFNTLVATHLIDSQGTVLKQWGARACSGSTL